MKKYPIFLALCATLFFFTQSCKKDDDAGPDITQEIVGTYTGEIQDSLEGISNTSHPSEQITITKVDNAGVRVTSSLGSFLSFNAALTESSTGVVLTVASQQSGSKTIEGVEITETYCGSYTNSTKKFVSIIKTTTGSPILIQGTEVVKQ